MALPLKLVLESGSSATILGGLLAKFQLVPNQAGGAFTLMLYPVDETPNVDPTDTLGQPGPYSLYWGAPAGADITALTATANAEGRVTIPVAGGDELGIYIRPDGIAEYHLNPGGVPNKPPVYVSGIHVKQNSLYKVRIQSTALTDIFTTKAFWIRQGPEWRYSADSQRQDRGLAPGASLVGVNIKARVRQRTPYQGGGPSNWVYGSFTRP